MKRIDFTAWETYVEGVLAFAVSAAFTAAVASAASWYDGKAINWHILGMVLLSTSLITAMAYVSKHPLPVSNLTVEGPATVSVPDGATAQVATKPTAIDTSKPISSVTPPENIIK